MVGSGVPADVDDVQAAAGTQDSVNLRRRAGRTVQEWIIERRRAEARNLLSDTELPVAEIARQVAMSDPAAARSRAGRSSSTAACPRVR
jgi:AraC-like DNA-binding protein